MNGRQILGGLAVMALTAALALPAQAHPHQHDGGYGGDYYGGGYSGGGYSGGVYYGGQESEHARHDRIDHGWGSGYGSYGSHSHGGGYSYGSYGGYGNGGDYAPYRGYGGGYGSGPYGGYGYRSYPDSPAYWYNGRPAGPDKWTHRGHHVIDARHGHHR